KSSASLLSSRALSVVSADEVYDLHDPWDLYHPMERIGLIAGNGRFPIIFAETARREGIGIVAVAHEGETPGELSESVDSITWIKVGQLDAIVRAFHQEGIKRAVMAGGIRKTALMENFAPDERGLRFLSRLGAWSDDVILRGVAAELESE